MAIIENIEKVGYDDQQVGKVVILYGNVTARSVDGTERLLSVNSPIFSYDTIITESDGRVSIIIDDPAQSQLDIGRMSQVLVDEDIYAGVSAEEVAAAAAEVEQIQQQLLAEGFDPTVELEPPAAGGQPPAGGGYTVPDFVRVTHEGEVTSGAETTGITTDTVDPIPGAVSAEVEDSTPTVVTSDAEVDETGGLDSVNGTFETNLFGDTPGTITITATNSDTSSWNPITNTLTGTANGGSYTLVVNNDGTYTFTQTGVMNHPDITDPNDAISLNFTATVTDSDGDSATSNFTVNVFDDGPTAGTDAGGQVDEGATVTDNMGFSGGADGATVTHINGEELIFGVDGYSQTIDIGLGELKVKANGDYSFTVDDPINNPITLTVSATISDSDGDSVTQAISFTIEDANEPEGGETFATVDDEALGGIPGGPGDIVVTPDPDANEATFSGTLVHNAGGDIPVSIDFAAMNGTSGTVGIETVNYSLSGGTLTATVAAGEDRAGTVLFTVTVDNAATGAYTVELQNNILHESLDGETGDDTENDTIAVLTYTVTDNDGSKADGTLTVTFNDDMPTVSVVGDTNIVEDATSPASGTWSSDIGADNEGAEIKVLIGSEQYDLDTDIILTKGTLRVNSDNTWTFDPNEDWEDDNPQNVNFTVRVTDGDSDVATDEHTIDILPSKFIVGSASDDTRDSEPAWTVPSTGNGQIIGGAGNDILIGDPGGAGIGPGDNANIIFVLDTSGSMDTRIPFDGNTVTRLAALQDAVENALTTLQGSGAENVRVHIVAFNTYASEVGTYDLITGGVINTSALAIAINDINDLHTNGWTNYEAGLQQALQWITDGALSGADVNKLVFVSDGEPNYALNHDGNAISVSAHNAIDHILGIDDSTNEVGDIESAGFTIEAVGINVGETALDYLDQVEGEAPGSPGNHAADSVTTAEDMNDVIGQLSSGDIIPDPAANDDISGGDGDDIIFGDVLNTDQLADDKDLSIDDGSGWKVFEELENNDPNWGRDDTIQYIREHHEELSIENSREGGDDTIDGGAGNDIIYGQAGADIIDGGAGNDILTGGPGTDTFKAGEGDDHITDYEIGIDNLNVSEVPGFDHLGDESGNPLGNLIIESDEGTAKLLLFDSGNNKIGSVTFDNIDFDDPSIIPSDLTTLLGDDSPTN
jgi:Ca2+-binding RTX toxin-like protein